MILREPEVELGAAPALSTETELLPSPPYAGKLGRVPALALSGGAASAEPAARTIGLSGATLSVGAGLAGQLNQAFAAPSTRVTSSMRAKSWGPAASRPRGE